MISINDYTISEQVNKLVIELPQSYHNVTSTMRPVTSRKEKLTTNELLRILILTISLYQEDATDGYQD